MRATLPTELLVRLMNASPEQFAAIEKIPARLLGETSGERELNLLRQRVGEIEAQLSALESSARAKVRLTTRTWSPRRASA